MQQVRAHAETDAERSVPRVNRSQHRAAHARRAKPNAQPDSSAAGGPPCSSRRARSSRSRQSSCGHENRQLDRELAALRAAMRTSSNSSSSRTRAKSPTCSNPATRSPSRSRSSPECRSGAAHVMYNAKMGMLMYDGELAPAPAAKSYQLWLVPADGKPISAGVFNPVSGRTDHMDDEIAAGNRGQGICGVARTRRRHAAADGPHGTNRPRVLSGLPKFGG